MKEAWDSVKESLTRSERPAQGQLCPREEANAETALCALNSLKELKARGGADENIYSLLKTCTGNIQNRRWVNENPRRIHPEPNGRLRGDRSGNKRRKQQGGLQESQHQDNASKKDGRKKVPTRCAWDYWGASKHGARS